MPETINLVIPKANENEKKYYLARLAGLKNIGVLSKTFKKVDYLKVVSPDEETAKYVRNAVAHGLVRFAKYKYLSSNIKCLGTDIIFNGCLLGALSALGLKDDIYKTEKEIELLSSVATETLLDFRLPEIIRSWEELTELAERLNSQCASDDERYDLILFLLAVDKSDAPKINVSNKKITVDGVAYPIPSYSGNLEHDVLATVIAERPYSVTIESVSDFSGEFVRAIRRLGE